MLKYGSNWLILSAVLFNSANDCITKKIIKDCPRWVRLSCSHLRMISTFRSTMHCSIRHTSISKRRPAGGLRITTRKKRQMHQMFTCLFLLKLAMNYHQYLVTIICHQTRGQSKERHLQQLDKEKIWRSAQYITVNTNTYQAKALQ